MKSPEERGLRAAWAYEARVALNMSPEQVVQTLGRYNPATIRKAETNDRHIGRPLWRALTGLYPRLAHEKGVTIPIPPGGSAPGEGPAPDLAAAITALVAELQASRLERASMESRVAELEMAMSLLAPKGDTTEPTPESQQARAG